MKSRWIACMLALVLALASVAGAAVAESFGQTPTASVTLGVGETWKVDTTSILVPDGQTLKYKTNDAKVASVGDDGVITAVRKGKATIGVGYDKTLLGLCKVTVLPAPKKVTLSDRNAVLSVGDVKQLTAALPKNTASALTYSSSNEAVATVDADGKVTALSGGKATITVKTFNDQVAECAVYVLGGKAPTTLSLNTAVVNIQVGETFKLAPSVDEGSDAYYKFASQDKKIARVDAEGVITGIRKGSTSVAVRTHNGLIQAVEVNVKPALKEVYGCLTNDPVTYMSIAKKLKLTRDNTAPDNMVVCQNGEIALTMTAGSCTVALVPVVAPKYCIQGIDTSMTPESAAAKLIANGWALTGSKTTDGVEQRAFTKDGDTTHYIAIATTDGTAIQSIRAQWSW